MTVSSKTKLADTTDSTPSRQKVLYKNQTPQVSYILCAQRSTVKAMQAENLIKMKTQKSNTTEFQTMKGENNFKPSTPFLSESPLLCHCASTWQKDSSLQLTGFLSPVSGCFHEVHDSATLSLCLTDAFRSKWCLICSM